MVNLRKSMNIDEVRKMINSQRRSYINKTRIYLAPCMEAYGENTINAINNLNYFWCGVALEAPYTIDYVYNEIHESINPTENIVVDSHHLFDGWHIYTLKIPKSMHGAYDMFLLGKYSKMYDSEQLQKIFIDPDPRYGNLLIKSLAKPVLTKHPKRKEFYENKLNRIDSEVEPIVIPESGEYDSLWNKEKNILIL